MAEINLHQLASVPAFEWTPVYTRDDIDTRGDACIVTLFKRGDRYQVQVTPPDWRTYATYAGTDARRAARTYLDQPLARRR